MNPPPRLAIVLAVPLILEPSTLIVGLPLTFALTMPLVSLSIMLSRIVGEEEPRFPTPMLLPGAAVTLTSVITGEESWFTTPQTLVAPPEMALMLVRCGEAESL